jgi:hypothetical protein
MDADEEDRVPANVKKNLKFDEVNPSDAEETANTD